MAVVWVSTVAVRLLVSTAGVLSTRFQQRHRKWNRAVAIFWPWWSRLPSINAVVAWLCVRASPSTRSWWGYGAAARLRPQFDGRDEFVIFFNSETVSGFANWLIFLSVLIYLQVWTQMILHQQRTRATTTYKSISSSHEFTQLQETVKVTTTFSLFLEFNINFSVLKILCA